ncbi:hypothetical protein GOV04_02950 [Candidatus Woesearchaeota archaeon]|nr:hypothetical protein [Candidatus Woesearchaeota archaeon]
MKQVTTDDGSITLYSEKIGSTYHSTSGAVEEAIKKFVEPAKLAEGVNILDFCFGLGYNSAAALEVVKKCSIIGLENDSKILKKIQDLNPPFKQYNIIKKAAQKLLYKDENVYIKIVVGDARQTIKLLDEQFDAVFFDPFDPKKQPELWSEIVFKDIARLMKSGGVLTTYSCAKWVRQNMQKAGLKVEDGPIIGRRGPSTIAVKE